MLMRVLVIPLQASIRIKPNISCEGFLLSSFQFIKDLSPYLQGSAHLIHGQIRKMKNTHTQTHTQKNLK